MNLIAYELRILDVIQTHFASPLMDQGFVFLTHLGDHGLLWIVITLLLLIHPKTRNVGILCFLALLGSLVFTNGLLKPIIARPRPFTYVDINLLIKTPSDYSFPSGHTTASFAVAFVMLKDKFKIRNINIYTPVMVLAILISFSRLYLYVHFPTDILGGVIIGYLCSWIALKVKVKYMLIL